MSRRPRLGLGLLVAASTAATVDAGPWGRERGGLYAKLSWSRLATTTLATPAAEEVEIPEFRLNQLVFYGELGLGHGLTGLVSLPIHHRSDLEGFGDDSGFGDLKLGLQAQIGNWGGALCAVRGLVQAPTGDETRGEGALPTGSGAWEGQLLVSVGGSFAAGRGFAYAEAGHEIRGEGLRDGFLYRGQIGARLGSRLDLVFNLRGVEPYEGGGIGLGASSAAGLGDGVRYAIYGPSAFVHLGQGWTLEVDVEGMAHARNIARGTTFRVGLSFTR